MIVMVRVMVMNDGDDISYDDKTFAELDDSSDDDDDQCQ